MKKLLISLVLFLCTVSFSHAGVLASGSVSLANSKLSLSNGTAFVDFSTADVLTDYVGKKLVITDSTGKKAIGYIKAQGTGETLGNELVTNGVFDSNSTGWSAESSAVLTSVAEGESGNCLQVKENGAANPYAATSVAVGTGKLYKLNYSVKQGTSSTYKGYITITSYVPTVPLSINRTSTSSWVAQGAFYLTAKADGLPIIVLMNVAASGSGLTHLFDNVTFKQVLTPSATGVTITSSPNGSTYNWASIESGFNYNDASGYTYEISSLGGFVGAGSLSPNYIFRRRR